MCAQTTSGAISATPSCMRLISQNDRSTASSSGTPSRTGLGADKWCQSYGEESFFSLSIMMLCKFNKIWIFWQSPNIISIAHPEVCQGTACDQRSWWELHLGNQDWGRWRTTCPDTMQRHRYTHRIQVRIASYCGCVSAKKNYIFTIILYRLNILVFLSFWTSCFGLVLLFILFTD